MKKFIKNPLVAVGCIILLLLFLLIVIRPWGHTPRPESASKETEPAPLQHDSAATVAESAPPAPPSLPVEPPGRPRKINIKPSKTSTPDRVTPDISAINVSGRVDSWEDWNSSFSDTVTRTYSAIFDSARLDTVAGARLVFSSTGRQKDFLPVRRVFCTVDSVKQLVKYTFPGQSVDFGIGVGFAAGVSLRGALHPREKICNLELFSPEGEQEKDDAEIIRNQFIVVFNSPPGYAYTLRTGIECAHGEGGVGSRIFYTRPAVVEFRRMVRFGTLARDAGDTVFILTANPKAIEDLSKLARLSVINAVLVPVKDPSEAEDLQKEQLPNVHLHISVPRALDQSFVVLNDSLALVERNVLDPDFKHTVQLKLHEAQMNRIGYPRVTKLYRSESAIVELRLLFRHFERLNPP